ncbi:uncharacterized protein [Dermacentor andersoni]|uniref:uncharacterized protein n=1 Tax=Dermacentor andersoni TaxID=34620 RepID=UPI003B3BDE72
MLPPCLRNRRNTMLVKLCVSALVATALCAAQEQLPGDICRKPPSSADMIAVLRPVSEMAIDCLADVVLQYKLGSTFVISVLEAICRHHALCVQEYTTNQTQALKKAAEMCLVERAIETMPCVVEQLAIPLHDAKKMNAALHWLYESAYSKLTSQ